jgi:glycosyltransferase involved in cell wall biosynthesis
MAQEFTDFEWLIVDDGSTDGTGPLVNEWLEAGPPFPIRYVRKENGGKHTAHNVGLSLARGRYFAIIDSDDWYPPQALGLLVAAWAAMLPAEREAFANVEGLCCLADGTLVGSPFPSDRHVSDNYAILRERERHGDTKGMYRTEVLRAYPFPEGFDGMLVPESLVWNRIARRYSTLFINQVTGFNEYRADGLTRGGEARRLRSAEPFLLYHRELLEVATRGRFRIKANLVRLWLRAGRPSGRTLPGGVGGVEDLAATVVGRMLHWRDLLRGMK